MKRYIIVGNNQEWCRYCWESMNNREGVSFYNGIDDIIKNPIIAVLCKKSFSHKYDVQKGTFLRKLWYKILMSAIRLKNNKEYVLVFYDWGPLAKDLAFIQYIKKQFPYVRLVYLFTNIIKISAAQKFGYLDQLCVLFDQIIAFDPNDAKKYGFDYCPLVYTRVPSYTEKEKTIDVFYVGNAKDRLDTLHQIYRKCVEDHLRCCFYINGVSPENQLYDEIHYNIVLSYRDVLDYISRSKCMVDAIQGDSSAMTIKVCEAVIYDKKLITTNKFIKQEPYYSQDRFLLYDSSANINSFIHQKEIAFSEIEKMSFSPSRLFEIIR